MILDDFERRALTDATAPALATAMRIVVEAGRVLGAERLVPITCAHIDGCLYHGDSGVHFIEHLVAQGGRVAVSSTLNVGALDLIHPDLVGGDSHFRAMARRLMDGHIALGCTPSWTCAPYQAGYRPGLGEQVAWGESNAVAFANSVLGARTNRYGDFLDICCAITGRAPFCGFHATENRRATMVIDVTGLSPALRSLDAFYPVLGAWLGAEAGEAVPVIAGLPATVTEDQLKALGAGAASTGAVGLFHVAGVTPEAPTVDAACQGEPPGRTIVVTADMVRQARDRLSSVAQGTIDCVAVGSPHFSHPETMDLLDRSAGLRFRVPFYVCTRRDVLARLEAQGHAMTLTDRGVVFVVDTCIVVTPILKGGGGVMMTSSAKFANYAPANTGYASVFGSLDDCIASAASGRVTRDESRWQ
jgi:hypothetical protein